MSGRSALIRATSRRTRATSVWGAETGVPEIPPIRTGGPRHASLTTVTWRTVRVAGSIRKPQTPSPQARAKSPARLQPRKIRRPRSSRRTRRNAIRGPATAPIQTRVRTTLEPCTGSGLRDQFRGLLGQDGQALRRHVGEAAVHLDPAARAAVDHRHHAFA